MKTKFAFRSMRVIIVLSLSVAVAAALIALKSKPVRKPLAETVAYVEVIPAEYKPMKMMVESYGTVEAKEIVTLATEIGGHIIEIDPVFQDGNFISDKSLLVKIDPRAYELEVERAKVSIDQIDAETKRLDQEEKNIQANLKISKAEVSLSEAEFNRLKALAKSQSVSQTALDNTEQRYLTSLGRNQALINQEATMGPLRDKLAAQRNMARVVLDQARLNLDKTRIKAPFDGWVLDKKVQPGQLVSPGGILGRIYKAGQFEIEVNIPIHDLDWLPAFDDQESLPTAEILYRESDHKIRYQGKVARVKAQMDQTTRTLPVIVEINDNTADRAKSGYLRIKPGMFVSVRIYGRQVENAFKLSRQAIHENDMVFVAAGDRLEFRKVHILRRHNDYVVIDSGIKTGEQVVVTPVSGAVDGMKIKIKSS